MPLLQSLFDERDSTGDIFFKPNNSKNYECEFKSLLNLSERRPDSIINWISQDRQQTIGFMEAKPKSVAHRTSKINVDLIRLGLMGKNAIDVHSLKSVFLVQAVGMNLTFYLLEKKSADIYQMVEIDHLAFPQSLEEVPTLIGNFDRVVRIMS